MRASLLQVVAVAPVLLHAVPGTLPPPQDPATPFKSPRDVSRSPFNVSRPRQTQETKALFSCILSPEEVDWLQPVLRERQIIDGRQPSDGRRLVATYLAWLQPISVASDGRDKLSWLQPTSLGSTIRRVSLGRNLSRGRDQLSTFPHIRRRARTFAGRR